jgi:hypothetical protein
MVGFLVIFSGIEADVRLKKHQKEKNHLFPAKT